MVEIAQEMGKDPSDAAFDLVEQGNSRVLAVYHMMGEADIKTALRFPWTSIGSDAGSSRVAGGPADLAHPRAYGNFPRVIARYVRDEHVLTLEDAIRKMTGWPAERMRLACRGLIRDGQCADVTIFDYDKIQDRSTYEQPSVYPAGHRLCPGEWPGRRRPGKAHGRKAGRHSLWAGLRCETLTNILPWSLAWRFHYEEA